MDQTARIDRAFILLTKNLDKRLTGEFKLINEKLDRLLADRHVSTLGPTALEDRFREAEKAMAGEEEEGR